MDFQDADSFSKALELNGSDLGGQYLYVDEAKPKGDSGGGFGGRSGDRREFSGNRFGSSRGRGNGRGRFGDSGRGRFGDGGRGRGRGRTPNKPSMVATGKGIIN